MLFKKAKKSIHCITDYYVKNVTRSPVFIAHIRSPPDNLHEK